jgi:hypothetical protein
MVDSTVDGLFKGIELEYQLYPSACALAETDLLQQPYKEFCRDQGKDGWVGIEYDDPSLNKGCVWSGARPLMCYNPSDTQEHCCLNKQGRELEIVDGCKVFNSPAPPCYIHKDVVKQCDGKYVDYNTGGCDDIFSGDKSTNNNSCLKYYLQYPQYIDPATYKLNVESIPGTAMTIYGQKFMKQCNEWVVARGKTDEIMAQVCNNKDLLAKEGDNGLCHNWCRQHPGKCDKAVAEYCADQIKTECGSLDTNDICIDLIPSFCSCMYWSYHDMPQPQCYDPTCQAGRAGEQPGYKTAAMDMSLDGAACGLYCRQAIEAVAQKSLEISGTLQQTCNLTQITGVPQNDKTVSQTKTGSTTETSKTDENSKKSETPEMFSTEWFEQNAIYIGIGAILFIVFIVIVILLATRTNERSEKIGKHEEYYRR